MIDRPYHRGDPVHDQMMHQSVRQLDEGWYDVKFRPKKTKCEAARGYLHGVVMPIYAAYIGECERGAPWPDDEAWERAKKQFRPREYIDPVTGAVEVVGRSTSGMHRGRVFEFTMLMVEWLESQNVYVPPPDKNYLQARERAYEKTKESANAS